MDPMLFLAPWSPFPAATSDEPRLAFERDVLAMSSSKEVLGKGGSSMSSSNLIRLAGLAALSSGVLAVVVALLRLVVDIEDPALATTTSHIIVFLLYLCSTMLLLLGLVGLYTSQSETTGILGLAGFLVAFVGTVLTAGALWFELFITPTLAAADPRLLEAELGIPGLVFVALLGSVGWVLFGAATLVPLYIQSGPPCFS
jgi:hypothetical protein